MSEESLDKKVDNWVNSQGFPFEMLVEKEFQIKGFKTQISEYYLDPETKKHREIDVTAFFNTNVDNRFLTQVVFQIECKYSKSFPWVLFTRKSTAGDRGPWIQSLYSTAGAYLFSQMQNDGGEKEIQEHPFFSGERIGYGIVQSIKQREEDKEDLAFRACGTAFKASWARIQQTNSDPIPLDNFVVLTIAIPVVLIDGKLFECYLNENGKTKTTEIKSGVLAWKHSNPKGVPTNLYIATKEGLEEFAARCQEFALIFSRASLRNKEALKLAITIENEKRIPKVASAPASNRSSITDGY